MVYVATPAAVERFAAGTVLLTLAKGPAFEPATNGQKGSSLVQIVPRASDGSISHGQY